MDIDALRRLCLSFPCTTEQMQWGNNLLFKVHGKMFAITSLEPGPVWLSLKVSPDNFVDLTERPGIIPAPYLARASWIAIESPTILPTPELASLLRGSYDLVTDKLPRKLRESLLDHKPISRAPAKRRVETKPLSKKSAKPSHKASRKAKRNSPDHSRHTNF